ncbi:Uu.00g050910.m01.CDS01 [Anthostomella pinea]|uniref:Uu.00g050910.m01.CDS01 n=1 Tax=Anthostomella pinea TaxID=933095 RepID=A0AAI8VSS6_9PEZI|nr:Uu.00g050910.m01.CDS01 [Anthostomella pinea]
MQFSITSLFAALALAATTSAAAIESRQNDNRPVADGACCVADSSLKEDVCTVNGAAGKCVPAGSANCGAALTCVQVDLLTCDANTLENGRPRCRPTA